MKRKVEAEEGRPGRWVEKGCVVQHLGPGGVFRFILHPSSFIPHPSSLILHPSSFILPPSSFRIDAPFINSVRFSSQTYYYKKLCEGFHSYVGNC
jgi:hypothetical protein